MATSQNGWTALDGYGDKRLVSIPKIVGKVRGGDVAKIFADLIERFDATVEDVDLGADDWGFAPRPIRGGTTLSNHASGTAIDLNAQRHGLGKVGTFTAAQVRAIRAILARYDGAIRWGGDYPGRKDEMHFEINTSAAHLARVVASLSSPTPAQPAPPTPVPPAPAPGGYTGNSIIEYLNSRGQDSSYAARARLAAEHGITGYTGTAAQNTALLAALRSPAKSTAVLAQEVIDGKHGSGDARKRSLGARFDEVQAEVNRLLSTPARKSNEQVAREVLAGQWGNNPARAAKLRAAGYNPDGIQALVNKLA